MTMQRKEDYKCAIIRMKNWSLIADRGVSQMDNSTGIHSPLLFVLHIVKSLNILWAFKI